MVSLSRLTAWSFFTIFFTIHSSFTGAAEDTLSFDALDKLATDLRQGDYLLVRVEPSEETAQKQTELCPDIISSLVSILVDDSANSNTDEGIKLKGKATEILTLCTTNNPVNREAIGTAVDNGVHKGLVALIRSGLASIADYGKIESDEEKENQHEKLRIASRALGNAAEAIWILTFGSKHNHDGFIQADVVAALGDIIHVQDCDSDCFRSTMWSAAALQNLAANYCVNEEDGSPYCAWEWNEEDHSLAVDTNATPIIVDGQMARTLILNYADGELIHELMWYVCETGPVILRHHDFFHTSDVEEEEEEDADHEQSEEGYWYSWPSRAMSETDLLEADYRDDEHSISIIAWAAMGVIKNLALSGPSARETILSSDVCDVAYAICLHVKSADWLEEVKALDAMYFLGMDMEYDCAELMGEDCDDFDGWVEVEDGLTCQDYEAEKLCMEFGGLVNEEGISAEEACCVCGGGYMDESEEYDGYGEDYGEGEEL